MANESETEERKNKSEIEERRNKSETRKKKKSENRKKQKEIINRRKTTNQKQKKTNKTRNNNNKKSRTPPPTCQMLLQLVPLGPRGVPQEGVHGHDHPGGAEATLRPVGAGYPLLHRVESAPEAPDALNGGHGQPMHGRHEGQAGVHGVVPGMWW